MSLNSAATLSGRCRFSGSRIGERSGPDYQHLISIGTYTLESLQTHAALVISTCLSIDWSSSSFRDFPLSSFHADRPSSESSREYSDCSWIESKMLH